MPLTQTELQAILNYNPETGVFTWRIAPGRRVKAGDEAGSIDSHGYWRIKIEGKLHRAHRLAWLYVNGIFPVNDIDHIYGNKLDNRISNLRDVPHRENLQNTKNHRAGRLVGCYWNKRAKKWQAQISINGKQKCLGYYETEIDAHNSYMSALARI